MYSLLDASGCLPRPMGCLRYFASIQVPLRMLDGGPLQPVPDLLSHVAGLFFGHVNKLPPWNHTHHTSHTTIFSLLSGWQPAPNTVAHRPAPSTVAQGCRSTAWRR